MKKLLRNFFTSFVVDCFKIQDKVTSFVSYLLIKAKGSDFKSRTKNRTSIENFRTCLEKNIHKRIAIFVAYHEPDNLSQSNINYLKILKRNSFEIMYVHNGLLSKRVKEKLNKFGCYVICRDNIGTDFGAYKDVLALINYYKLSINLDWILLCNDSNFCIGGVNSEIFINKFEESLNNKKIDFISLCVNYELEVHHQSYFLCLSKVVFLDKRFANFWNTYKPISNRVHAINKGERKLTSEVLRFFKKKVIFNSYNLYENVYPYPEKYNIFSNNLPKNSFRLRKYLNSDCKDIYEIQLRIKTIVNFLEDFNPTHTFGLLNVVFLESPFFKKSLVSTGAFSFIQIHEILRNEKLDIDKKLLLEVMEYLINSGTNSSYWHSLKLAAKKGIHPNGTYFDLNKRFLL